jgi:hypothetical protein
VELFDEKNQRSKISCQGPFNDNVFSEFFIHTDTLFLFSFFHLQYNSIFTGIQVLKLRQSKCHSHFVCKVRLKHRHQPRVGKEDLHFYPTNRTKFIFCSDMNELSVYYMYDYTLYSIHIISECIIEA